jgi:hypothetical protein
MPHVVIEPSAGRVCHEVNQLSRVKREVIPINFAFREIADDDDGRTAKVNCGETVARGMVAIHSNIKRQVESRIETNATGVASNTLIEWLSSSLRAATHDGLRNWKR